MKGKVYVGISGGVDSAVSAALVKEDGYDVTGVFIKIWQPEFFECTWEKDRIDAMRVAVALNIPFREIDLSTEYRDDVVQEMVHSYKSGRTPNPDVTCNEKIKFGSFFKWAVAEGANYVATGHYARRIGSGSTSQLHRGSDASKDQSYFLYRMSTESLQKTLFPVGGMLKDDVRAIARKLSLPVATKPDSQGLCFVGDVTMRDFLKRYIPVIPGLVLSSSGDTIGTHDGAALYTIGQRHGFTIHKKEASPIYYVTAINIRDNTLTASSCRSDTEVMQARIKDVHELSPIPLGRPIRGQARYREQPSTLVAQRNGDCIDIQFEHPHCVSAGQSFVLYDEDHCLGGGKIV